MFVTKVVLGVVLGAAGGYGWHRLVGCSTGSCPITANPYISTLWGALIGLLLTIH